MRTSFEEGSLSPAEASHSHLGMINSLESMSIIDLNRLAMHYLSREAFQECFNLLKQAESILHEPEAASLLQNPVKKARMTSLTLNNFGCYYKK